MPMSRLPRSDWLGSSTSPPLTTRSNLSSGAMAARAEPPRASASEPAVTRKSRRDALGMGFLLLRYWRVRGYGPPLSGDDRSYAAYLARSRYKRAHAHPPGAPCGLTESEYSGWLAPVNNRLRV